MRLNEFYEPSEDQGVQRSIQDTRKHKLTLEDLNKLRKYRDIKKAEQTEHENFVQLMYAQPSEQSAPGGGLI